MMINKITPTYLWKSLEFAIKAPTLFKPTNEDLENFGNQNNLLSNAPFSLDITK